MDSNKNVPEKKTKRKPKKRALSKKSKSRKSSVQFVKKNIKPKVKLDSNKVVGLCVGIIVFCVLLLVATIFIPVEQNSKINENSKKTQKIEKVQNVEKKSKKNVTKNSNQVQQKKDLKTSSVEKDKKSNSQKNQANSNINSKSTKNESEKSTQKSVQKQNQQTTQSQTKNDKVQSAPQKIEEKKSTQAQTKNIEEKPKKIETFPPKTTAQTKTPEQKKPVAPSQTQSAQKTDIEKFANEIPPAKNGDKIILVFDDGGQNLNHLKKFLSLPFPISIAVMPKLQYSAQAGNMIRESGKELMLHQPMQSVNLKINPGPGAITPEMSVAEIQSLLKENIAEIGPIAGINNHEGSLITEDETRIGAVMEVCAEKNIFFLDSRTSSQTRVPQVAMSMGYGYFQRDVFLDNQKTRENILSEIKRGIGIANKKGHVVMIGHVWSADILPDILMEVYPILQKKGYRFFTVSKSGTAIFP